MLPTAEPYRTDYAALFNIEDELVISTTEYFDAVTMVKGLGSTVSPPASQ